MKTLDDNQATDGKQATETFTGSDNAAEINRLHAEICSHGKTAFEKAIHIGDLLVANKAAFGKHGRWLKWIDEHLDFGCRQAQNYMSMFERRDELSNAQGIAHLGIEGCLSLLRKTDQAARANGKRTPVDDFGGDTTPVAAAVINEADGLISKTAAKKSGRYNGNGDLWDDKSKLAHPTHNKIYKPNGGQMPDQAANVLHDLGVIREPSVSEMYSAIERESKSARTIAKEQSAQARLAKFAEIEALPEVQVFSQFLATQSKRDAAMILAVLALRPDIITDSAETVVTE